MSQEIINIQNEKLEARRAYWIRQVEEWKKSGLGQVEYCKKTGVKYERLKWWICRDKKIGQFLSVRVIPEKTNSEIEIRLGSLRVIVKRDFEEDFLRRVIKSIGFYHV